MSNRTVWIDTIRRFANELAMAPPEAYAGINDHALQELDYLIVDMADAIAGRKE